MDGVLFNSHMLVNNMIMDDKANDGVCVGELESYGVNVTNVTETAEIACFLLSQVSLHHHHHHHILCQPMSTEGLSAENTQ